MLALLELTTAGAWSVTYENINTASERDTHLHPHHPQLQAQSIPTSPYPQPDLGPSIGRERGSRTRERSTSGGGMGGVEMAYDNSRSYAHAESYPGVNGV